MVASADGWPPGRPPGRPPGTPALPMLQQFIAMHLQALHVMSALLTASVRSPMAVPLNAARPAQAKDARKISLFDAIFSSTDVTSGERLGAEQRYFAQCSPPPARSTCSSSSAPTWPAPASSLASAQRARKFAPIRRMPQQRCREVAADPRARPRAEHDPANYLHDSELPAGHRAPGAAPPAPAPALGSPRPEPHASTAESPMPRACKDTLFAEFVV